MTTRSPVTSRKRERIVHDPGAGTFPTDASIVDRHSRGERMHISQLQDMRHALCQSLLRLREASRAALIVVDHVRKSIGRYEIGSAFRGASALHAVGDS